MNENKYTYPGLSFQRLQHLLPLFSVLLLLTTACCKKEELVGGRILKFSFDSTSQPHTDVIHEIEVFVFDDRERLIGRASTQIDGTVALDYPQIPTLHCVAWGNSKDSGLEFSPLQPGDFLKKGYLALKTLSPTRAGDTFCNTPPDLFRGAIQIDNNATTGDRQLIRMVMLQTTASIHIKIDGLPETTGTEEGDYSVVVGEASARIDFYGDYSSKAVHRLTGTFNTEKEYIIPPFHLFPSAANKGIKIDILHNGKLLKSIIQTSGGQPILPVAGKELTLLIKFAPGGVEVRPPGWNPTDVEIVYPK